MQFLKPPRGYCRYQTNMHKAMTGGGTKYSTLAPWLMLHSNPNPNLVNAGPGAPELKKLGLNVQLCQLYPLFWCWKFDQGGIWELWEIHLDLLQPPQGNRPFAYRCRSHRTTAKAVSGSNWAYCEQGGPMPCLANSATSDLSCVHSSMYCGCDVCEPRPETPQSWELEAS